MAVAIAPGRRSWLGSLMWLLLAGCAVALVASDASLRESAVALLERAGLAAAPEIRDTALVMPGPEDSASFAADSVLAGLATGASARAGAAPDRVALLAGARSLALDGLVEAPGGTQQRLVAGRVAYAIWESEPSPGSERVWESTLTIAARTAPGFQVATDTLAADYLGAWPRLSEPERERARPAIAAALRSPAFVRRSLPAALATLGPEEAMRLLPRERSSLEAAAAVLQALGQSALAQQAASAAAAVPPSPPPGP